MTPTARDRGVPLTVNVVVGVFAVAALITFLTAFGAFFAVLALPVLVVAGALATLAVRLYLGGRVARALAPASAVTLLLLSLAVGTSAWWIVIGLATTAASVALLLAPSARAFFAGPAGRAPRVGVSVTLVQVVACVIGGLFAVTTLSLFGFGLAAVGSGAAMGRDGNELTGVVGGLFGMAGSVLVAWSFFYGALAAVWIWSCVALPRSSRGARIAVTIVCGLSTLPFVPAIGYVPGLTFTVLVFFGAVAAALWLPADARRHFGEAPLPVVDGWHRTAVTFGATVAANAPTITPLGTAAPGPAAPYGPRPAGPAPARPTSRPQEPGTPGSGFPGPSPSARPTWTPGPGARHVVPVPRSAPSSGPMPVADLEDDPVTAPVRLGRHARPDVGPAQPV